MTVEKWSVSFTLGYETAIYGRVQLPKSGRPNSERYKPGNTVVGHGRKPAVDYHVSFDWLSTIERGAVENGGEFEQREIRLSSVRPARDWYGQLEPHHAGWTGGSIVEYADVAIATWTAVGGVAGIIAFLKMIKEMKSLWGSSATVEITLDDNKKVKLSNPRDVNKALAILDKWEKIKAEKQQEGK